MSILRGKEPLDLLRRLCSEEDGHDFVEYTLLMAFLSLSAAAMYIGAGDSLVIIWSASNTLLNNVSTQIPRS